MTQKRGSIWGGVPTIITPTYWGQIWWYTFIILDVQLWQPHHRRGGQIEVIPLGKLLHNVPLFMKNSGEGLYFQVWYFWCSDCQHHTWNYLSSKIRNGILRQINMLGRIFLCSAFPLPFIVFCRVALLWWPMSCFGQFPLEWADGMSNPHDWQ